MINPEAVSPKLKHALECLAEEDKAKLHLEKCQQAHRRALMVLNSADYEVWVVAAGLKESYVSNRANDTR
jgi:hypothetical protein